MSNHTEAPASVTIKTYSPSGYDIMLTLRDDDAGKLMGRLTKALEWLDGNGFKPGGRSNGSTPAASDQAGPPNDICPVHSVKMQRREKNGESWYSHKAYREDGTEFYCRGK